MTKYVIIMLNMSSLCYPFKCVNFVQLYINMSENVMLIYLLKLLVYCFFIAQLINI